MKNLFLGIAFLCTISSFAFKVLTEVVGETRINGVACCYDMLHIIYNDDGTYLTHGYSSMGTCCETSGVQFSNGDLSQNDQNEIIASSAFINSRNEAISIYKAENGITFNSLNIKNTGSELILDFDSEYKGEFDIYIRNISGVYLGYTNKIQLVKGKNKILVPLVLENKGIRTKYKVLVVKGDKGFRGTISYS